MSYHIAQYTNIISDLRKEIFRLKTKIAEQSVSEVDSNKTTFEGIKKKQISPEVVSGFNL